MHRNRSGLPSIFAAALLAAAIVVGGVQPPVQAQMRVHLVQALDSLDFLVLYVARHFDMFAEEGVDLEFTLMTAGGGPNLQAVISGNADFTPSAIFTALGALRQGQPLVFTRNLFDSLAVNLVLRADVAERLGITADSPLEEKYAKLRGLTFGVTRPGALTDQVVRFIIADAGLVAGRDVEIVGVGTGPAALAALERGTVDALAHVSPVPEQAVTRGSAIMLFNNSAGEIPGLRDFLGLTMITTWDYVRKNPEAVRAVNRALTRASAWVLDNPPEETAALLTQYIPGIELDVMTEAVRNNMRAISRTGEIRESSVIVPQQIQIDAGLADEVIPWETFVTNDYLE